MADYYPLIARAVAGLEKNTGEARRALYERARTALVTQLRGVVPALSESDITRERLALEESIRKVEAEAARRSRVDTPAAKAPPPVEAPRRDERADAPPPPPARKEAPGEPAAMPAPPPRMPRPRPPEHTTSLTDEGLKGFRDVVAESDELGGAAAQASRSAREAFNAVPSPSGEFERQEPRLEPEGLRPTARERPPRDSAREARDALRETRREQVRDQNREADRGFDSEPEYSIPPDTLEPAIHVPESRPSPPGAKSGRPAAPPRQASRSAEPEDERPKLPRRSYRGLITAMTLLLVLSGIVAAAYWQRETLTATVQSIFGKAAPKPQVARDPNAAQQRPKIADRIEPNTQNPSGSQTSPTAQVAQRAVLYEEDPTDPQGKRFQGSVIWRTESVPAGAGQPTELAVRADVELPDRRVTMTFSLRRNTDQALPASHTVEVMFNLPADFPGGGISNVPGVLMKQAEATRGVPLAGLAVKVTTGFFLIGLSAVDADVQRNMALLKERSWFDIPVVYNNGTRAILAIEKGTPGERAFEAAFKSWGVK
jgi:hypothetical protein